MMNPECRIKSSVIEVGHVPPVATDCTMNSIVDVLERTFISRVIADNLVIGEC